MYVYSDNRTDSQEVEEVMPNLGKNIRHRREDFDLKQYQLAEMVGVTASMISQIEHNKKMPTKELMI